MNRAERRRQQKAEAKTYQMSRYDVAYFTGYNKGLEDTAYKQVGTTIQVYTTAMMATLHNEFGFGKKRMARAMEYFQTTVQRFYDDRSIEPKVRAYITKQIGIDPDDFTGAKKMMIRDEIDAIKEMGTVKMPKLTKDEAKAAARAIAEEIEAWE